MESMLFSPLTIRGLTLRNRIVVSPMLTYSAINGYTNDTHLAHLAKFAVGGAGLVFVESTKIDPRGCSTPRDLGLWKDEFVPGMRRIVDLVKCYGAACAIQLGHSGRKARRSVPWEGRTPLKNFPGVDHGEQWDLIAPSPIPHAEAYEAPREMTHADIAEMVDAWSQGARRAEEAGFDVMEIHGAHGYLIHQFLSATANKRTDRYGGSLENRMRFAVEVVRGVRRYWPEQKPLFLRISATDEIDWTIEDSVALARTLGEHGVDVIDCSAGGMLDSGPVTNPVEYGYQVKYAKAVRHGSGVKSMAVGMIVHADQAEEILQAGEADLVALGREYLVNPNWALDAALKLGIPAPYAQLPPVFGHYLSRRQRAFKDVRNSTWQMGIRGDGK
ncbi:MAG: NADH:flavin oxidoreductase/NADH oxidase [Betaproteobacteria bacterium]|nr:NADH:flavin oxidoreductase/NADH oxidase [Betaproteobacteria bacterium]